jgi:hypothetical protein
MSRFRFLPPVLGLTGMLVIAFATPHANAGEADVVTVKVSQTGARVYRFDVTVRHHDEGWKHYADRWQVLGPGDNVLGERILGHPHEQEQPFTRSLSGVRIPAGLTEVRVRAGDLKHGFGGLEKVVTVPVR